MESLANLESFVRSAEGASFSAAARRLSLTPAAVSRNVAMLERNLGVRLFHRSTRRLTLTEAGERFLAGIGDKLEGLQAAIAEASDQETAPSGMLKVSMPLTFGLQHILPLLGAFRTRYPGILIDWQLDSRPADLVGHGFDAAIGGGFELSSGMIARRLAPIHLVAVAAPSYMAGRTMPETPDDLIKFDGIGLRLNATGRVSEWTMRDRSGRAMAAPMRHVIMLNDPLPIARVALAGLGVGILAVPDVLEHMNDGSLVRLLPDWFVDLGSISLYHATPTLLPRKTRLFSDYIVDRFQADGLSKLFDAN